MRRRWWGWEWPGHAGMHDERRRSVHRRRRRLLLFSYLPVVSVTLPAVVGGAGRIRMVVVHRKRCLLDIRRPFVASIRRPHSSPRFPAVEVFWKRRRRPTRRAFECRVTRHATPRCSHLTRQSGDGRRVPCVVCRRPWRWWGRRRPLSAVTRRHVSSSSSPQGPTIRPWHRR